MKKFLEKVSIVSSCKRGFHLIGQLGGLFHGPLRQEAGMDHEMRSFTMVKRLSPQPVDQFFPIIGGKHVLNRVFRP